MYKCAIIADKDPCIAAVIAHLMSTVFDTGIFKEKFNSKLYFYATGDPCFDSTLAAEIVGNPIGDFEIPSDLKSENVVLVITATGIGLNDSLAKRLIREEIPVLKLGDFHPSKIDFAMFSEHLAGQNFATALADASVGLSRFLMDQLFRSNSKV